MKEGSASAVSGAKMPHISHASSDLNETLLSEEIATSSSSDEDHEKSFRQATETMLHNMSTNYASAVSAQSGSKSPNPH